jgi:hypothetical protein
MKLVMFLTSLMFISFTNAGEYTAASYSGQYVCKKTTNGYCAKSTSTGQCTHEWSDKETGGFAKFQCQKWTGEVVVKAIDKSSYECKDTGNGACAVKKATGQCGPSWDDEDGGMYQCQKWTGEIKVKPIDKSKYVCKKTTNGYCAQNQLTGQCGHEWKSKDGDAKFACNKWINN